jgi:transposase
MSVSYNGLQWQDAPSADGPHKTLYHRRKCWGEHGMFARHRGLAAVDAEPRTVTNDVSYWKAHRAASSLRAKRRPGSPDRPHQRRSSLRFWQCAASLE